MENHLTLFLMHLNPIWRNNLFVTSPFTNIEKLRSVTNDNSNIHLLFTGDTRFWGLKSHDSWYHAISFFKKKNCVSCKNKNKFQGNECAEHVSCVSSEYFWRIVEILDLFIALSVVRVNLSVSVERRIWWGLHFVCGKMKTINKAKKIIKTKWVNFWIGRKWRKKQCEERQVESSIYLFY